MKNVNVALDMMKNVSVALEVPLSVYNYILLLYNIIIVLDWKANCIAY